MNAPLHHHDRRSEDRERPTMRVPAGSPCRVLSGCSEPAVGATGRCAWHQPSRLAASAVVARTTETRQQRGERLIAELIGIGAKWLSENTSVMPGSWS